MHLLMVPASSRFIPGILGFIFLNHLGIALLARTGGGKTPSISS
jgi:hypothetical protein